MLDADAVGANAGQTVTRVVVLHAPLALLVSHSRPNTQVPKHGIPMLSTDALTALPVQIARISVFL